MTPGRPPAAEACCPAAPSTSHRIWRPRPAAGRRRCWRRRGRGTDPSGQSSMRRMSAAERVFLRGGACCVWLKYTEAGELEFSGQDLAAFGQPGYEYEYFITVAPDQFPALRQALGVA